MELKTILESLLFIAPKAMTPKELRDLLKAAAEQNEAAQEFKKVKEEFIVEALDQLARESDEMNRAYHLTCIAGAWQYVTKPEVAPWVMAMAGQKVRPARLSQPSLETLTIVAYRQPLTRAEIEQVRGVAVDGTIQTLLERGLIEPVGRAEAPGKPMTYGTTQLFLEYFGLRSLEDLPAADELRKIVIEKPEELLTADEGSPTAELTSETVSTAGDDEEGEAAAAGDESSPEPPKQEGQ